MPSKATLGRDLVVRRRRDRDPGRVEHGAGLGHARAVDVGRAGAAVPPGDQVVRAAEGDARDGLVVRRRRDRDPGRVEHGSCRAHTCAVDVGDRAGAAVLPGDEVVRAVEGDARSDLAVRRRRDRDPGRVEHGPGLAHARAVDVGGRAGAAVLPGDEVVRAVEGDARSGLGVRRRRDRDPGRVEHGPGLAHTRAVDVDGPARAVVLPGDEVVRAVEGDARSELAVRRRRDRDPGRVEHGSCRAHTCAVDVVVRAGAIVLPGDEVVRAAEGDAWDGAGCSPPSRSRARPGRARRRPG